jgi:hypothetical protein
MTPTISPVFKSGCAAAIFSLGTYWMSRAVIRDASGVLRLLHGSTTQKAVILDAELATYLGRASTHTGIMVARPLEVA